MARSIPRRALAAAALLALVGCGGGAPPPLARTLEELRRALDEGDDDALYSLSTSETQAVMGREGVRALTRDNRDELRDIAAGLGRAEPEIEVSLRFEGREPVALAFEDGDYRLGGALLAGTSLETPEGAVLALRAALARRSFPAVLRILTRERARALVAELDAIVEAARDPLDFDVSITGERAIVRLPEGLLVILERESGEWRIVDVAEDPRRR